MVVAVVYNICSWRGFSPFLKIDCAEDTLLGSPETQSGPTTAVNPTPLYIGISLDRKSGRPAVDIS